MHEEVSNLNDDALSPAARAAGREPALTGCPWHDVNEMLQAAGLRPTRQRMALGWLLFGKGARHLTAEMLYEEATHPNTNDHAQTPPHPVSPFSPRPPKHPPHPPPRGRFLASGQRRWRQDLFR